METRGETEETQAKLIKLAGLRLRAKIEKTDNGCLVWTGAKDMKGYGYMKVCGKRILVHRFVFQLKRGDKLLGSNVKHSCHNKLCCNPSHLYQ